MGATFPVLTRFVTRSLSELREKVGALYFINSLGAVLGCLVADFWWIPDFGLELTVFGGSALNLAAGLVALYFSKHTSEGSRTATETAHDVASQECFSATELRLVIAGIGLSGFVAMLYEIAWTRVLALTLGATTHAFSLMLVTFIAGIAMGAWAIYRWRGLRNSLHAFAWAELALGFTVLSSMIFYADLPFWFLRGASLLARQPSAYPLYELLQAFVCFLVMAVPAACLGLTLPLVSRIATVELAQTGRSVGKVFAVNTVGTVLGAICTGLFLMPWLGLARTFAIGILANTCIGLGILLRKRFDMRQVIAVAFAAVCFVWAIGAIFNDEWHHAFSAGLWRSPQPPTTRAAFREAVNDGKILYYKDGAGSTVTVISKLRAGQETLSLKVNGKTDAASAVDVTTQRLLGHIPMLLSPGSKDALVIGMGSGMTAAAVARHPSIQHVDIVEISPEVAQAARLFADYNDRFWENPRIRITVEDAKSFLKISRQRYDAIISEPSNPWMAGVAGVFSQEYYQDCRACLKPNGLMAQWVQIYETSDELLDVVLRTFGSVFPYVSIWESSPADLVLVGSMQPIQVDLETMRSRLLEPSVNSDLRRIEMVTLPVFLAREVVSQQNGAFVASENGPIHSDFFPVLEFQAAKAFFLLGRANRWRTLDENFSTRPTTFLGDYLKSHSLTEDDFVAFGRFYLEYGMPESDLFQTLLLRWQREQPEAILPMELMAQSSGPVSAAELEAFRLRPQADFLAGLAKTNPDPLRQYEGYLMQTYRANRSVFNRPPTEQLVSVLERLLQVNPSNQRVYRCHLAEIAWDKGDDATCMELANKAFDPSTATSGPANFSIDPKAPQAVLLRRLDLLCRAGKLDEAWTLCQSATRQGLVMTDPALELIVRKLGTYVAEAAAAQKKQSVPVQ
jgi:predicted membrane-bound spermidine synthase